MVRPLTRFSDLGPALESRFGAMDGSLPRGPGKHAAVALVLRPPSPRENDPRAHASEMLVIKRAVSRRDPWSGHMALPGGRVDAGDVSLVATAMRETLEETALDLATGGLTLGQVERVLPSSGVPPVTVWPFVFRVDASAAAVVNSAEVEAVHWFPVEALMAPENQSVFRLEHRGVQREFPSIQVEGRVIWGLTYRIVTRFLHLL